MRLSTEAVLMLLAVGLYLFDALVLLSPQEAVLVQGWRGRWRAGFGAHRWRLRGKEPYLPNPFTPHRPLFKLAWRFDRALPRQATPQRMQVPAALNAFAPFVWNAAVCLFVLLPAGLFLPLGSAFIVAAGVALCVNNVTALVVLFARRESLHLPLKSFAGLAFEFLVCPPFSVNLVRRICARQPVGEDFVQVAARLLPPDDMAGVHAQCLLRLDEQIDCEAEGSVRMAALKVARLHFLPTDTP